MTAGPRDTRVKKDASTKLANGRKSSPKRKTRKAAVTLPDLHGDLQHYPQCRLRWSGDERWMPKSQVILLRDAQPDSAIIFLHGWGGSAGGTWGDFPASLASQSTNSASDIFFLDYPSRKPQVHFATMQIMAFLRDVVRNANERIANPSLPSGTPPRTSTTGYKKIVLVAHSLGAIIVRRALLDIARDTLDGFDDQEFERFRLLFFAPAHSGSRIPMLIGSGFGLESLPGATLLGLLLKSLMPSLHDLEEGSKTLTDLADDCRDVRENCELRNATVSHVRAFVYHAQDDRVVIQANFDRDFPSNPVMRKNHRSICKPGESYLTPVEALRRVLDT